MPLLFRENINDGAVVGIWNATEEVNTLLARLSFTKEYLKGINHPLKQLHLLSSRILIDELLGANLNRQLNHNEHNKPFLKGSNFNISISHSSQYVALIADKLGDRGIDIERIQPKIKNVALKFMSDSEIKSMGVKNITEKLYVYWCAKESLYKFYGKKNLIFKEQLYILPFEYMDEGVIKGEINSHSFKKSILLKYKKVDEYMLVYTS